MVFSLIFSDRTRYVTIAAHSSVTLMLAANPMASPAGVDIALPVAFLLDTIPLSPFNARL